MKKISLIFTIVMCLCMQVSQAQQYPFWKEVQTFKQKDSLDKPKGNEILFIGSSSFTLWTKVQSAFPAYPIINRAFGGSTLLDVIHYSKEVIFTYDPKQIVIYCGENDLASSDTVTAKTVFERFTLLFGIIRTITPDVPVAYVSLKPSPSRKHLLPKMEAANDRIRNYLAHQSNTSFIDVYHKMLNADGTIMDDIFLADKLHMNPKGYKIWQTAIEPYLIK